MLVYIQQWNIASGTILMAYPVKKLMNIGLRNSICGCALDVTGQTI